MTVLICWSQIALALRLGRSFVQLLSLASTTRTRYLPVKRKNPSTTTAVGLRNIKVGHFSTPAISLGNLNRNKTKELTRPIIILDNFFYSSEDESDIVFSPKQKLSPKPSPIGPRKFLGLSLSPSALNSPVGLAVDLSDLGSIASNDIELTSSPGSPRRKVCAFVCHYVDIF